MNIALLAKTGEQAANIRYYLKDRGHRVWQTDERVTADTLAPFDIGVSWFYRWILRHPELDAVKLGIVNCHPAMLPWGRGAMPNVWALAHDFPAGVSMHYMSAKVDEGDIIAQREVKKELVDTGQTLYAKLLMEQHNLFMDIWPAIETLGNAGLRVPTLPQTTPLHGVTPRTYRVKDTAEIDDLDGQFGLMGRKFINILRARTFPPYEATYITDKDGQKYYVRVSIEKAPDGK